MLCCTLPSAGRVCIPRNEAELVPAMPDESLTPEVAQLLEVVGKTVYSIAQKGLRPVFKVGGQWRFKRVDLDAWLEHKQRRNA
jgi:excisionase family DNA binding protein